MNLPTLIAFGWLNLPMLGWMAAAAAPLLIHLWSRRRYREVPWAAMQYLLAAIRRRYRRWQLEQWILLAIRTLLITLLVLAVAQPYLESSGLAAPADAGRTHHLLVIDGSYSMNYQPEGETLFQRAKELAGRIVEECPQGDAFTLILMATPPRVVVGKASFDAREVVQEIDALRASHTSVALAATLAAARRVVEQVRADQPRLSRHEVCILTDLARVGWWHEGAAREEVRKLAGQVAEAASLVVLDLGQAGADNLAVTGVTLADPVVTVARDVQFEATLKNFSHSARPRQTVDLLIDGRRIEQRTVDVPAQGEASVALAYRFETPGNHTADVRIAGDKLETDNHRWLAVPVKSFVRVLCIDGRPSGVPFQGATGYLQVALSPRSGLEEGMVRVEVAAESALLEKPLSGYDCVFLADVAQFTQHEARVLFDYAQAGGSLLFFMGDQVVAERYNLQLAREGEGAVRLLPAKLGEVVDHPAEARLDPLGYRHPILEVFRGQERSGLITTPVTRSIKLAPDESTGARTVLALADGEPLVVERSAGRGRVILVGTSADTSWTAMPMLPSYVPLVQEMLAWCVGGQLAGRNVGVGQPIEGTVPAAAGDVPVTIQTPQGTRETVRAQSRGVDGVWTFVDTDPSGIYTAQLGRPGGTAQSYAVNLDTAESDLARLDPEELRGAVWAGVSFAHQTTWQELDEESLGPVRPRSRLHESLLYAVLGLVFTESILAWRLGRRA